MSLFCFRNFWAFHFANLGTQTFIFSFLPAFVKDDVPGHGLSQAVKLSMKEKPANQLIGSLSCYLPGFIHPKWCRISSNRILGIDGCERYQQNWWCLRSWIMMPIQLMIALGLRIFVQCPQLPVIFSILNTPISLLRDDIPHPSEKKTSDNFFWQLLSFLGKIPCINKETVPLLFLTSLKFNMEPEKSTPGSLEIPHLESIIFRFHVKLSGRVVQTHCLQACGSCLVLHAPSQALSCLKSSCKRRFWVWWFVNFGGHGHGTHLLHFGGHQTSRYIIELGKHHL